MPKSNSDLLAIRDSVDLVGRLSDSIVHIGPFSIGIDGILSWIPAVGELYSAAAGGFIVVQGARAGVPSATLAGAGLLLAVRTVANALPVVGALFSDVFTAHKWAARMIASDIDARLASGVEGGVRLIERPGHPIGHPA